MIFWKEYLFKKAMVPPRISELPVVFKTKQHNKISISLLHNLYYLTSKISENVSRYPPPWNFEKYDLRGGYLEANRRILLEKECSSTIKLNFFQTKCLHFAFEFCKTSMKFGNLKFHFEKFTHRCFLSHSNCLKKCYKFRHDGK